MARTLEYNTLQVSTIQRRAQATFIIDGIGDFYSRGDAVDWVEVDDTDDIGGTNWYVDEQHYAEMGTSDGIRRLTVVARQPGFDWTWNDLAPIESRSWWPAIPSSKNIGGTIYLGYWPMFSNWDDLDNWLPAETNPIMPQNKFKVWKIEFISDEDFTNDWLGKKNGTWPAGFGPPVAGAGTYYCVKIKSDLELWRDPQTGTSTDFYRHYAWLVEAPTAPNAGQLTWTFDAWTNPA